MIGFPLREVWAGVFLRVGAGLAIPVLKALDVFGLAGGVPARGWRAANWPRARRAQRTELLAGRKFDLVWQADRAGRADCGAEFGVIADGRELADRPVLGLGSRVPRSRAWADS